MLKEFNEKNSVHLLRKYEQSNDFLKQSDLSLHIMCFVLDKALLWLFSSSNLCLDYLQPIQGSPQKSGFSIFLLCMIFFFLVLNENLLEKIQLREIILTQIFRKNILQYFLRNFKCSLSPLHRKVSTITFQGGDNCRILLNQIVKIKMSEPPHCCNTALQSVGKPLISKQKNGSSISCLQIEASAKLRP